MRIISADQRLQEEKQAGAKVLILGPPGIGKTTLIQTLSSEMLQSTLVVDAEAGLLAVQGVPFASVRPRQWRDLQDLAAVLGGPNPSLPASSCYSEAHYIKTMENPELAQLARFKLLFVDSLTEISRRSFAAAEQSPEAVTDRGKKDLRQVYGIHARAMLSWLHQLQHARDRHVVLIGVLERHVDDLNVATWRLQAEGGKLARELPAIVDVIATYNWIDFGDRKPARALVCDPNNVWRFPSKDRSGRLAQFEPPDLGALLTKLTAAPRTTPEQPAQTAKE